MALIVGETVSYETRDEKIFIFRTLEGVKVDLVSAGSLNLADAKTEALAVVAAHKTAKGTMKTTYNGRITALANAATRTHADTDAFGNSITINEYDILEDGATNTYYIPSTEVTTIDADYDVMVANINLDGTHDDDLTTAINALT